MAMHVLYHVLLIYAPLGELVATLYRAPKNKYTNFLSNLSFSPWVRNQIITQSFIFKYFLYSPRPLFYYNEGDAVVKLKNNRVLCFK
jgi:hypothetical protein